MITAVLFDVDGVLIDSESVLAKVLADEIEREGFTRPSDRQILDSMNGRMFQVWFPAFLPELTRERAEEMAERASVAYRRELASAKLIAGALETLSALKKRGVKTALVTNQPEESAASSAKFVGFPFDAIGYWKDGMQPKPAPDIVLDALAQLRVPPSGALMVGDTEADVAAGAASGVRTVLLSSPLNRSLKAEKISSLPEILKMVEQ